MKVAIVALTKGGAATAQALAKALPNTALGSDRRGQEKAVSSAQIFLPEGLKSCTNSSEVRFYQGSTAKMIGEVFADYRGLVLIMASGIAVRSLATCLQGKAVDPAVVVVDEQGQFAISLLSGHLGRANDLARTVARVLGGTPVITTSTDVQGRLAVDVLAVDLGVKMEPLQYLKQVNSRIARGEKVMLISDYPLPLPDSHPLWQDDCWLIKAAAEEGAVDEGAAEEFEVEGVIPEGRGPEIGPDAGMPVILTSKVTSQKALFLRPPNIVVGVGCRKATPGSLILTAIHQALKLAGHSPLSVKKVVSIEEKAQEQGIRWAAEQLKAATEFFPRQTLELILQQQPGLARSDFVKQQMGVEGVCEPASLAGCRQGKLILGKQAGQGVTVALAEEKYGW